MAKKSTPDLTTDLDSIREVYCPAYDNNGYLPQTGEAYTTLAIVRVKNDETAFPLYVVRQTDIVNNQIIKVEDSPRTDKANATYQLRNLLPKYNVGPSL